MEKTKIEQYIEQRLNELQEENSSNRFVVNNPMAPSGKKEYAKIRICEIDSIEYEFELLKEKLKEDGKS
ncbi:MAG: hypothetical protein V4608_11065 [Bacteroidota bacterium]